jgi:hypothetical protein
VPRTLATFRAKSARTLLLERKISVSWPLRAVFAFGLLGLCVATSSCSGAEVPSTTDGASGAGGSGGAPVLNPLGRPRCVAPPGVSASPRTTDESVQLLNALPKPTSVACFVESLQRPLFAYATSSIFSAQPALSAQSPRVFLKLGELWISIVMDGDSSYLLEFGDLIAGEQPRSIKGELLLPLRDVIPASAPYERVLFNQGTSCGLCHFSETRAVSSSGIDAFVSIAFRPRVETRVSVDTLRAHEQACDVRLEPHRCEMLSALFGGGEVVETPFPDSMATFF